MNESFVDNLEFFERRLIEKSNTQIKLYTGNKVTQIPSYTPRDVLNIVSSQITAIQHADCVKNKCVNNIYINRQPGFLSVDQLPACNEVQKHSNKFESQYATDTQLIDLLQKVEAKPINPEKWFDSALDKVNLNVEKQGQKNEEDEHVIYEENLQTERERSVAGVVLDDNDSNEYLKSISQERLSPILQCKQDSKAKPKSISLSQDIFTVNYEGFNNIENDVEIMSVANNCTNIFKENNKKDFIISKELFTEDINDDDNIRDDRNLELKSPLFFSSGENSEADDIIIEPNKTFYGDVNVDDQLSGKAKSIVSLQLNSKENNTNGTLKFSADCFKSDDINLIFQNINEFDRNHLKYRTSSDPVLNPNTVVSKTQNDIPENMLHSHINSSLRHQSLRKNIELNQNDSTECKSSTANKKDNHLTNQVHDLDDIHFERNIISSSPILNNTEKEIESPSHLTCDLDYFEKFENIAFPLIATTNDMEVVKQLINSQIISNELYSKKSTCDCTVSPILEISSRSFRIENETCYLKENEPFGFSDTKRDLGANKIIALSKTSNFNTIPEFNNCMPKKNNLQNAVSELNNNNEKELKITPDVSNTVESNNINLGVSMHDEIIFSSDEESDYIHKEFKDLPFTCVLETTSHNTSVVLDRTMYVGFQTASNKSIQVGADSFIKAKSILNVDTERQSLTELVDIFDNKSKNDSETLLNRDLTYNSQPERDKNTMNAQNFKNVNNKPAGNIRLIKEVIEEIENAEINDATNFKEHQNNNSQMKVVEIDKNTDQTDNDLIFLKENINNFGNLKERLHLKRPFEGFRTARNKKIKLSDAALAKCKKVFEDIDVDEDFNLKMSEIHDHDSGTEIKIEESDFNLNLIKTGIAHGEVKDSDKNNVISMSNSKEKFNDNCCECSSSNKNHQSDVNLNDELIKEFEDIEMCLEEKESNATPISMMKNTGAADQNFNHNKKCEYNKSLEVNHMGETENLLHDLNLTEIVNKCSVHNLENDLKVSKTNTVQINNNAEIDLCNNSSVQDFVNSDINKQTLINTVYQNYFNGFKTASNKKINVSEKALINTRNIFKDIDLETKLQIDNSSLKQLDENKDTFDTRHIDFKSILTANNELLNVTDTEATRINKYVFQGTDIEGGDESVKKRNDYLQENRFCVPEFKGFKTASNKTVNISEEALKKAKNVFEDLSQSCKDVNKTKFRVGSNCLQTPKFTGFQTASNRPVKISKEAHTKSKDIFKDINLNNDLNYSNQNNCNCQEIKSRNSQFVGLHMANCKSANTSENVLESSKKIFKDIELNNPFREINHTIKPDKKIKEQFPKYIGIQTANNKPVNISEEAVKKSKDFLQDLGFIKSYDLDKNDCTIVSDQNVHSIKFQGFQTGNNKPVHISIEALQRTKDVFNDINFKGEIVTNTGIARQPFQGFKTASNKKVSISKQALEKSKKVFDDVDMYLNLNESMDEKDNHKTSPKVINNKENTIIQFRAKTNTLKINDDKSLGMSRKEKDFKKLHITDRHARTENVTVKHIASDLGTNLGSKISTFDETISGFKMKNEKKDSNKSIEDNVSGNYLNTQVLDEFQNTLNTEDFQDEAPQVDKHSGSPILSCPKAKRRTKFETPYCSMPCKKIEFQGPPTLNPETKECYKFDDNYKKMKKIYFPDLFRMEEDLKFNTVERESGLVIYDLEDVDLRMFHFMHARNDLNSRRLSINDLRTIFENSVNKKIIPDNWLDNHLRLIIWKLINYESNFPNCMQNACRVTNVLEQLKYRYDVELYNAKRPALRKILERDDVPSKLMVLCVVGIYLDGVATHTVTDPCSNIELLLTDGWYTVKAIIDRMLSALVCSKKIVVGTKLATCGAELLNCEQGVSPWEDTSSIRLKIHGNCTRRARPDARLGYHANAAILSTLGSVKMDGGKVAKLRIFITRVYPPLYVEKFENGSTVTRTERLERLHQVKYESERATALEKLYEEVEKEFSENDSQDSEGCTATGRNRWSMETGSQIAKHMKKCFDPVEFSAQLTSTQHKLLQDHTLKRSERLREEIEKRIREKIEIKGLCVNRNVVSLLKLRVVGYEKSGLGNAKGLMSIWKPNDAILDLIKEGTWIEVKNVIPTTMRQSEIQLSAGRQTIFNKCNLKHYNHKQSTTIFSRQSFTITDLVKQPQTEYNEIDTVGLIIDIDPSLKEYDANRHKFQNVYLTDHNNSLACVMFWAGIKKCGYEKFFEIGQVVCCVNLQKRLGNSRRCVPNFRVTEFTYFTKIPKYQHLALIMNDLHTNIADVDMQKLRAECLVLKNKLHCKVYSNENVPFKINYNALRGNRQNFANSSSISKNKADDLNLSGLDFESTFKQSEQQDISPRLLQQKRQISDKIAKLKMYGEPPPLNHIYIINKSKNASSTFKNPLASNDVSDNSVVSVTNNDNSVIGNESICNETSMINSMDTKINRAKLNYSKRGNDDNVDPFAEEFDGSPPLSLD